MNKMLHALNPVKAASATAIIYKRCISIVKTKIPSFLQGHTSAASSKAVIIHSLALPKSEPVLKNDFDLEVELENSKATDKVIKDENIKSSHPIWDEKKYSELIDCLAMNRSINKVSHPDDKYFEQIISRIEDKLNDFRIDGVIVDVLKGPVVDTFLLELGKGVKVSKVTSSADDLSGALYGAPIRIVYPMRGRTSVGIEVPRNPREIIYLDEVLASSEYKDCNQHLPIAIGKDAYGKTFIVDLADMPHMLVAGATGAGKSVFINTLLVSLLVKKSPQDMKLILIDPKQLELAQYAKLPHLALPVINDGKSASLALLWAVQEMERRYSIMMEFGVRNVETFNSKILHASSNDVDSIRKFYEAGHNEDYKLPYVVVIIDEFADLILSKAGKEIENNVCRLAGKARAAGIHLVIATQRPSVDVITGLIKSNFPTRISFRVTTSIDSRTILSAMGAEKLLGKGDMLYKRGVDTARVHSSYVDEDEILALVNNLCSLPTEFDKSAMDFLESDGSPDESDPYAFGSHIPTVLESGGGDDELYDEAVSVVMEYRAASASMLQRRLKIGYNRAANLVELMEEKGIVGPAQGSKPRKILVSLD
ncbi:MAG: DNA translocase FtsK [Bacteriovoracaceae bacterium]|nr:DNA translocase FtsK [Bacteriovoracaceae bacterium]